MIPKEMKKLKRNGRKKLKDKKMEIISQQITIGKQGAALSIPECEFVKKLFNVTNSVPHVILYFIQYVGKNWEANNLGPMMKKAEQCKWEPTEHPLIFHSADKDYIKIFCATSLMGITQEVVISQNKLTRMTTTSELIDTTDTDLFKEVERQVPTEPRSQHDSDVRLIKSANPVRIQLKPDAGLPRKSQYPLHLDAEAGIINTIVLIEKKQVVVILQL